MRRRKKANVTMPPTHPKTSIESMLQAVAEAAEEALAAHTAFVERPTNTHTASFAATWDVG